MKLEPWVKEEFLLDQDVIDLITKKSEELNMTFNELVNELLKEFIFENSQKVSVGEYIDWVKAWEKGDATDSPLESYLTITLNDQPVARITPIEKTETQTEA